MTLQNRVDPWGALCAINSRGAWLGNRGILHNSQKQIMAPWRHKSWVTCRLEFQGIKREIFSPNSYSELFFLDEATALAAGHRPCAECRRERYNEFKTLWCAANPEFSSASTVPITQIDKQLHSERAIRGGSKVTFQASFQDIPSGAFIEIDGEALLMWKDRLHSWSASGYSVSIKHPAFSDMVTVLTPISIVRMLHLGFQPQIHESVFS